LDVLSIPASRSVEEARIEAGKLLGNQKEAGLYVADNTCNWEKLGVASRENKIYAMNLGIKCTYTLDRAFGNAVSKSIAMQGFNDGFIKVLNMLLVGKEITSVHVVTENILDHMQFMMPPDSTGCSRQSIPEFIKGFVPLIQKALPNADLVIHETFHEGLSACSADMNALLISDRHANGMYDEIQGGFDNKSKWEHKCAVFCMPFENTLEVLVEQEKLTAMFTAELLLKNLLTPNQLRQYSIK
jgi:hypothetical protein